MNKQVDQEFGSPLLLIVAMAKDMVSWHGSVSYDAQYLIVF